VSAELFYIQEVGARRFAEWDGVEALHLEPFGRDLFIELVAI
jgi:hypothetical protein